MAKRFRIEMGFLGLTFVFLLLVCLFLWMFILGVWFGERMVGKGPSPVAEKTLREKVPEELPAEEVSPPPGVLSSQTTSPRPAEGPAVKPSPKAPRPSAGVGLMTSSSPAAGSPESVSSSKASSEKTARKPAGPYFTLQVASFRDSGEAERYARLFRDRGYTAQVVRVNIPGKGVWYRVYVGRFGTRAEAEKVYRRLRGEKLVKKAYIKKIVP